MTHDRFAGDAFDELVSGWLDDRAHGPSADDVLDRVIADTSGTQPLPPWRLSERWLPTGISRDLPGAPRLAAALVLLGLLLLAALALVIGAGSRRLPPPFGLAKPGIVAFVSDGHVWASEPDGSDRRQLTFGARIDATPTFSRDGTRIAFKRYPPAGAVANWEEWGDVVVADTDGRNEVVLDRMVHAPSPPIWSPDGRFIVYSKIVGAVDQVVVAATDGSSVRVVTTDAEANWAPSINPNGTTIAFVKGFPRIIGMYAIEVDGSNEQRLTSISFSAMDGLQWSPDGSTLLFSAGDALVGGEDIYAVGLDGRPEHRVVVAEANDQSPAWSPDGTRFAYLNASLTESQVLVADADGARAHAISELGQWFAPQWSPDGLHVLAVDARQGGSQPIVALLDPSGEKPTGSFALPDVSGLGRADVSSWQRLAP
jgi:TolB protein